VLAVTLVVGAVGPRGYLAAGERAHVFALLGAWTALVPHDRRSRLPADPRTQSDTAFSLYPLLLRAAPPQGWATRRRAADLERRLPRGLFAFEALSRDTSAVVRAARDVYLRSSRSGTSSR